jgi:formylglycine-generating enzyme required for sulfatase activity
MFSGRQKLEFGRRLGQSWRELADYFNIPASTRSGFERGSEPHGIWDWLDDRHRLAELPEALHAINREDLEETLRLPSSPREQDSPYPGLSPFEEDEAKFFFGRTDETETLISCLEDGCRFLAVTGASGTGKSSLVYAGVLHRLRDNAIDGSVAWPITSFRPGFINNDPFLAVAIELRSLLQRPRTLDGLARELRDNPATFARYANQALTEKPTSAELVLFVDQFEELFRPQVAENSRQKFIDLLKVAAHHPRVRILVTLRIDFLSQFVPSFRSLADIRPTEIFYLEPPGLAALTDMIRLPAQAVDVTLEDRVANQILEDALHEPGALPLVAFCLRELYNKSRREGRITLEQYEEMGRLHGAIEQAAQAVESPPGGRRDALEKLFSKLVAIDSDGEAVVRRATYAELSGDDAVMSLVWELSHDPGRLLICDEHTVELAHDALLDKWSMLKTWIERNSADMRLWTKLGSDANTWQKTPRDKSLLLRRRRLQEARKLIKRRLPYFPPGNTRDDIEQFIKASNSFRLARWRTIAYGLITGLVCLFVFFALIMVYVTPSHLARKAMPIGSFGANEFGLYDVLGNVWEWTADCLTSTNSQNVSSPQAADSFDWCLARGGSWDNYEEWKVRASYRLPLARDHKAPTVGFRVARKVYEDEKPGDKFQDCPKNQKNCPYPWMVILPAPPQHFTVKAPEEETGPCDGEKPRPKRPDSIKQFAIGRYEVTVKEWNVFLKDKGRMVSASENGVNGDRPITNIKWDEIAKKGVESYVGWLKDKTGKEYWLPSGAEWEYAARGDKKGDNAICRWWPDPENLTFHRI